MPEVLQHIFERPVTSGSAFRVPKSAYPAWGLIYDGEMDANKAYRAEWNVPGGENLPELVGKASTIAFGADYAEIVRQGAATSVRAITEYLLKNDRLPQKWRLIDIGAGAGASTLAIHQALPDAVKDDMTVVLIDPSEPSLAAADELMTKNNIKHEILVGSDTEVTRKVEPFSALFVTGVGSIHHHADIPFRSYSDLLAEQGFAVFADWHQQTWTHPRFVYNMVSGFEYPGKEADLAGFLKTFPQAKQEIPLPLKEVDQKAMRDIAAFWKAVADISQQMGLDGTPIWFLEGHRDVSEYVSEMNRVDLETDSEDIRRLITIRALSSNPQQILKDSSLLQVTVGQRAA